MATEQEIKVFKPIDFERYLKSLDKETLVRMAFKFRFNLYTEHDILFLDSQAVEYKIMYPPRTEG